MSEEKGKKIIYKIYKIEGCGGNVRGLVDLVSYMLL